MQPKPPLPDNGHYCTCDWCKKNPVGYVCVIRNGTHQCNCPTHNMSNYVCTPDCV